MRTSALTAFVAVALAGSTPVAAQQPRDGAAPKANPFLNQFAPPGKLASPPPFLFPTPTFNQRPGAQKSTVCGMTLIPGDPKVDAGIRRDVPANAPKFSIQSVDPKVCRP